MLLFFAGAAALIVLFVYFWYVKPMKAIKKYVQAFQDAGYRVKTLPYSPF